MDRMIDTNFVIRHTFILARVLIFIKTLIKNFSERLEIFIFHIRELISMMSITNTCSIIITRLRSFSLLRFLRRTLNWHLNGRIAIFNLIYFGNQTLHVVNLSIAVISDWFNWLWLLGWILCCTWIDLINSVKLIIKALESIGSIELVLLFSSYIFN